MNKIERAKIISHIIASERKNLLLQTTYQKLIDAKSEKLVEKAQVLREPNASVLAIVSGIHFFKDNDQVRLSYLIPAISDNFTHSFQANSDPLLTHPEVYEVLEYVQPCDIVRITNGKEGKVSNLEIIADPDLQKKWKPKVKPFL